MRKITLTMLMVAFLAAPAWSADATTFDTVMEHYAPVRLALVGDSMDGVNRHGAAIAEALRGLQADFSAEGAGITDEVATVVREKLGHMIAAADAIAEADSLQAAREAFYELSMPLVRWHAGVAGNQRPAVAYCPMHKKSWLQPDGEIGNPYGGMPRCGEIVAR
jgi:hypothetical protein